MSDTGPVAAEQRNISKEHDSLFKIMFKEFNKSFVAKLGLGVVIFVIIIAMFAPYIAPRHPYEQDIARSLEGPSADYIFGTDNYGRCIFSRVVHGSRLALYVGVIVISIGMSIGVLIGITAAFCGGIVDTILMRLIDVLLGFPFFLLAILIAGILGPNLTNAMIAVGIASLPAYARLTRGQVLSILEEEYISAAYAVGGSNIKIVITHILPNIIGPIIVYATLRVSTAIIMTAGLSFLGLGAQPPAPDWGAMLSQARQFMILAPWMSIFPGLAIMITVLGFNFLGDGLRDALDPKIRS